MSAAIDWAAVAKSLDETGAASLGALLSPDACNAIAALYGTAAFRSTVVMARHGFGRGEYKYFADPVPSPVSALREALYPPAATIANRWAERLGGASFPPRLADFHERCAAAGQDKPTPLLLRYGAGDHNCLHQDIYGAVAFPLQVVVLLSDPAAFSGGTFVMTEQRPRMQSRAEAYALQQGEGLIFATAERPKAGTRGDYRVKMRHGVSTVRSGTRITLGLIFHNAA
ncbi:MAG: 2OG-Fe(II) oxygenase [Pseudomonadota bacterium]